MGSFRLGKPVISRLEYSSGARLPLGKLDPRVFGVHVNSPTGDYVRLHDANWGGVFLDGSSGLSGFPLRGICPIKIAAGVGCGTNYQIVVKVHYGSGTNYSEVVGAKQSGMCTVIAFADGTSMTSDSR